MTIRITGDGPKITATGSGSTVLVEISTGQHDPGSFSGVHNDLTGRSTTGAHVGTAVSIDPSGFAGNLDESITNAQLLAAAVDDLTTGGGGGGGGGAALSDTTPQALGTAAAGTGTAAARDDHVHAMPTASDVGAAATAHASAHASAGSDPVTLAQSQVTNLTTDLAAKVPTTRTVNGHALSADVTITASDVGAQPADSDLTTIAGLTATTDSFIQSKSSAWAARTVAQVKTDLDVPPIGDLNPVWPNTTDGVGVFVLGGGSSAVLVGTVAVALGVTLLQTCTVSAVKIAVNSGGSTGAKARIGIYAAGSNGRPGSLVLDCGTVLIESGGTKTLTLGTPQQLTAGLYFFATSLDTGTSATIYGYASSTSGGQGSGGFRGAMPDNLFRSGAYSFATTGGAMTSTPTWTLGVSSGAICANIGLTIASVP